MTSLVVKRITLNDVCSLVYRPISNRNNDITSGKKNQVVVPSKDVSNSSTFDALNSIENDNDLGKPTLVDDNGKPLPKAVSTENADSNYEVEDVVNDHVIFMASTGLIRGDDSGYGTNILFEQ
uniref:Uncharacterized protein n=1 Tax=Tanacetum cinerariifolium TaxID=118510 RepID=A0A6L2L9M3_TANCI|nr:hypothetical protein [Tanacetum cinerariifolium]